MENLVAWDIALFRQINSVWITPQLDVLMGWVGDFGFWKFPLIVLALVVIWKGTFKLRTLLGMVAICLLIGDALIVQGIREVVNRGRPWQTLNEVRYVTRNGVEIHQARPFEKGRSMPSGHVCNNVSVAWMAMLIFGTRAWWIWLWVALLSYSRIYSGSHFPLDVIASFFIATTYALTIAWICQKLWEKYSPQALKNRYPRLFNYGF